MRFKLNYRALLATAAPALVANSPYAGGAT